MEKTRKSNFELLRIIAMFMIIAHHFAVHSNFQFPTGFTTMNRLCIQFITMGGKIGVNIFVLISGYFLVNSTEMKWSKVFKIWSQLVFYAVAIYLIFVFMGKETFTMKGFITNFFPVGTTEWWFASTYLILYIFTPYINSFVKTLEKQQFQKMLIIMTVVWCILPTVTNYSYGSSSLLWFLYIYFIGGYIRLYGFALKRLNSLKYLFISGSLIVINAAISIGIDYIWIKNNSLVDFANKFYGMQTVAILLISVFLFLGFEKMKPVYNRAVNMVSSTTFGIYLLHDEGIYMRKFLWNDVFVTALYSNSKWFIAYSILVICLVFAMGCIIELFRIYLIEKNYMELTDRASEKLIKLIKGKEIIANSEKI